MSTVLPPATKRDRPAISFRADFHLPGAADACARAGRPRDRRRGPRVCGRLRRHRDVDAGPQPPGPRLRDRGPGVEARPYLDAVRQRADARLGRGAGRRRACGHDQGFPRELRLRGQRDGRPRGDPRARLQRDPGPGARLPWPHVLYRGDGGHVELAQLRPAEQRRGVRAESVLLPLSARDGIPVLRDRLREGGAAHDRDADVGAPPP